MVWMETLEDIPLPEVGALVQKYLDDGAMAIVVTRQSDGDRCTVNVRRE